MLGIKVLLTLVNGARVYSELVGNKDSRRRNESASVDASRVSHAALCKGSSI